MGNSCKGYFQALLASRKGQGDRKILRPDLQIPELMLQDNGHLILIGRLVNPASIPTSGWSV